MHDPEGQSSGGAVPETAGPPSLPDGLRYRRPIRSREVAVSYQFELPRVRSADLDDAIRERAENWAARSSTSDEEHYAYTEHVEGITHAVDTLVAWMGLDSGDTREIRVVVTGHANPGHLPREGYSDEHITISIGVLPTTEVGAGDADPMEPPPVEVKADPQMMDRLVAGP